jgi:hypothetical protein
MNILDYVEGGGAPFNPKGIIIERHRKDNLSDSEARQVIDGITTTTEECAEDVCRAPGSPCSSDKVLKMFAVFVDENEKKPSSSSDILERIEAVLGCTSESCVLVNPKFRQFTAKNKIIDMELETRFKAKGPRNSEALLSNFNIDDTLKRWARKFTNFFPCHFAMMDFERTKEEFETLDLVDVFEGRVSINLGIGMGAVKRPSTCFGCIVNTDSSSGPGIHWVAVFIDIRPPPGEDWTIEYFNSTGRPPPKAMVRWMEKSRARLAEHRGTKSNKNMNVITVPVTDLNHQESQTECGLYSLYYIRRRLEGTPYSYFSETLIPDSAMKIFRTHVFRSS